MKELVESIARALVDHPEEVNVRSVEGSQATILELRVHPEDLGKVIGRQGRTAKAVRTLLGAAVMKVRKRFTLGILEEGGTRGNGGWRRGTYFAHEGIKAVWRGRGCQTVRSGFRRL